MLIIENRLSHECFLCDGGIGAIGEIDESNKTRNLLSPPTFNLNLRAQGYWNRTHTSVQMQLNSSKSANNGIRCDTINRVQTSTRTQALILNAGQQCFRILCLQFSNAILKMDSVKGRATRCGGLRSTAVVTVAAAVSRIHSHEH